MGDVTGVLRRPPKIEGGLFELRAPALRVSVRKSGVGGGGESELDAISAVLTRQGQTFPPSSTFQSRARLARAKLRRSPLPCLVTRLLFQAHPCVRLVASFVKGVNYFLAMEG